MTIRAAQMAQIILEQWNPRTQSAEDFAMHHFEKDLVSDLEIAVAIYEELADADDEADAYFERHGPGDNPMVSPK